jgi:hypothetical protein
MEPNGSAGQVSVTVLDGKGGRSTKTCSLADFEQSDIGAILERTTIPWPRVERVSWELPPREPDGEEPSAARVRVLIDDGTPDGEEIVVSSDRFEAIAWAVGLLVDDRADAALGTIHQRRIIVPWHAVREYERVVAVAADRPELVPTRPDSRR